MALVGPNGVREIGLRLGGLVRPSIPPWPIASLTLKRQVETIMLAAGTRISSRRRSWRAE